MQFRTIALLSCEQLRLDFIREQILFIYFFDAFPLPILELIKTGVGRAGRGGPRASGKKSLELLCLFFPCPGVGVGLLPGNISSVSFLLVGSLLGRG